MIHCWSSQTNELIKYLLITNPGYANSKPRGGLMVRSIERVTGTPRDSVVNSKLSPSNDCKRLGHLNSIHWKLP